MGPSEGTGIVLIALYLALAKRIKHIRGMAGSGHQVAGDLWKIVRSDQSRAEQANQCLDILCSAVTVRERKSDQTS